MPSAGTSYQKPRRHTLTDESLFLAGGLAVYPGCAREPVRVGPRFAVAAVFADSAVLEFVEGE